MAVRSNETLMSSTEAAEFLRLSHASVRQYVRRKLLIPIAKMGSSWVFTKRECQRFRSEKQPRGNPSFTNPTIKKRTQKPTSKV